MSSHSRSYQVPRAPLHAQGVTSCAEVSRTPSADITPPSSLLRTHASILNPLSTLAQTLVTNLCRLLSAPAGSRTFPTLSLRIFLYVLESLPRLLQWCSYPFLPTEQRPSRRVEPVGAWLNPHGNFCVGIFRGCNYLFIFRPVDLLATQIAPTAVSIIYRAAVAFTSPHISVCYLAKQGIC